MYINKFILFNPVVNCNINIMLSLFLGFVKTLFVYWFDHPSSNNCLLKTDFWFEWKTFRLSTTWLHLAGTSKIRRFHKRRAHEFINLILYLPIPVLLRKIDSTLFHHLLKLIIPLEYLLSPKINKDKLNFIHNSLVE